MNHSIQLTTPAGKEIVLLADNAEPNRQEKTESEMKGAENAEILQERIATPPSEDEAYTLEGFGDISLSNIDFVPPPPTTLSPRKISQETLRLKVPADGKASISGTNKRRSGYTHKIRAPSLSKARINATEMTFESLVANIKQSREAENTHTSLSRASGSRRAAASEGAMHEQQPLADLKNLGGGAVISAGGSHDVVENSGYTKASDGGAVKCAAGRDGNGDADAPGVEVPRQALRGAAKLPKRPAIPRWEDNESWQSATGGSLDLGVTSRYKLA